VLVLTILLVSVLFLSLFVAIKWFTKSQSIPIFFVGVEFAYGRFNDCKPLVDKVKNYTNLFVIGSLDISRNQTMLNETCDYIYHVGLYFLVFFIAPFQLYEYNPYVWIIKARQKYGAHFLGAYAYDEPGGNQLDQNNFRMVIPGQVKNYTDAAKMYVEYLYGHLEYYLYSGARVFTADYGLYWFDYKAGYGTVLAEFGWNHSRQLNVALCRGAAKVQTEEWGVMITSTYNGTPYMEPGDELYNDMFLAYNAGARYVVVFDYPKISQYGILTEEHFDAMKKFWNYIRGSPESHGNAKGEVAYVLPRDYGFGFRSANDAIWGLWKADQLSRKIWDDVNNLLDRYGSRLDVVYTDPELNDAVKRRYNKLIFWNETVT